MMTDDATNTGAASSPVDRGVGRPAPKRAKRLRWKLEPRETGLRAITAGPRSSWLTDGETRYACVSALLRRSAERWYWVAGWDSQVPSRNTCCEAPLSLDEAKAAAMAYVRAHLKTPNARNQAGPEAEP